MITGGKKRIGVNVNFNRIYQAYHTQVPFGRYAVFRKACFTGHYYAGNSMAAADNTFFFFKKMGKKTYRIRIRSARPLYIWRRPKDLSCWS